MYKLLVMTDIHLLEAGGTIIDLDPSTQFKRALDHALGAHPDAQALVLTGDLTHHGRPEQYAVLREIMSDIEMPVIYLIGNHDERDAFVAAFPDSRCDANGFVQSAKVFGSDLWVTLDTKHAPSGDHDKHIGTLCADRMAWLSETLDAHQDKRVLLFMHHPPFDTGFPGMDAIKLQDGAALLSRLRDHPRDVHLIAGHVHRTISGTASGIGFSMFKSTCHQMPMALDTVDTSLSVPEPAAYGLILVDETSIIAHSEDFEIAIASTDPQIGID